MILINNENQTKPSLNLALEEYALLNLDLSQEHLLFYINEPAVIIGKHQNTHEEINHDYIQQNHIQVIRRVSGGGTVYHDHGNLNFSFLTQVKGKAFNDYRTFTQPIIQALVALDIPAELTGRNDIIVKDRKISGNAQYRRAERMFCHGTLLFNTDLNNVVAALNVKPDKIQSKGIKSIRSRVANISEFLIQPMTVAEFKQHLINTIFIDKPKKIHHFSDLDWQAIEKLAKEKYENWDWNYGKSPEFNFQNRSRFNIGEIDIRFNVKNSRVAAVKIYGDFFAQEDISGLETLLLNLPYEPNAFSEALATVNLHNYFGFLTVAEFLTLCFPNN
ncbi:MAG: lipoate--protein ligase [Gammaproteobacteria bacterium RIFCSPHIGHO2_12_FULL_35_23]|nr:MAG: lipoate--protein ligase [Gammaproteobacteria bacterium RIFCSPHIGHO2_12_FULL_35_23]